MMPSTVRYDVTLDELVSAGLRGADLSGMTRRNLMGGFYSVLALALFTTLVIPDPFRVKAAFGLLTLVVGSTINIMTLRLRIRRALRAHFAKLYGNASAIRFEYELRDAGIAFRSAGTVMEISWPAVLSTRRTQEFLEIVTDKFAVAQIPNRAFVPTETMHKWAEAIATKVSVNLEHPS